MRREWQLVQRAEPHAIEVRTTSKREAELSASILRAVGGWELEQEPARIVQPVRPWEWRS